MEKIRNDHTRIVVICGVFVALATVLSVIKILQLPYGGSITLFSMVPPVLIGYYYGLIPGLSSGLVYGVLRAMLGLTVSQAYAGVTGWSVPAMTFLDYILAFAVLGVAGAMFHKMKTKPVLACGLGGLCAGLLRLLCHFASGYILWGGYAEWFFTDVMTDHGGWFLERFSGNGLAAIYSLVYNGSYMIPETLMTVIGCCAVAAVPAFNRLMRGKSR